jgi:hypothetical protein
MANPEIFINNTETTLNGAINNSVTSITVTSAAAFPATGNFRIQVDGTEVMKVTAVSGNVFTVVRGVDGTTAISHDDLDLVVAVLTKASLEEFRRDADPWANLRAPYRIVDTNSASLDSTDFTEVNFTDNAASSDDDGNITITKDDHVTPSISALVRTAPSTPYTITGALTHQIVTDLAVNGPRVGLCFRETSSSDLIVHSLQPSHDSSTGIRILHHGSPTSSPTNLFQAEPIIRGVPIWQRIEDDGTDIKFYLSVDGVNFQLLYTELRGASFTTGPDQVGFFIDNVAGVDGNIVSLVAWDGE